MFSWNIAFRLVSLELQPCFDFRKNRGRLTFCSLDSSDIFVFIDSVIFHASVHLHQLLSVSDALVNAFTNTTSKLCLYVFGEVFWLMFSAEEKVRHSAIVNYFLIFSISSATFLYLKKTRFTSSVVLKLRRSFTPHPLGARAQRPSHLFFTFLANCMRSI